MPEIQDNFERAFADLSYAQLKDKAPKLLDYMIGFQVIDKDEDDTHAAGVFGFKVGNQWFYAPMFFLNGEMKGGDMLYSKSQDLFIPLQENWVNYIISRKPDSLGGGTSMTESQLGVMNPDFRAYIDSPLRGWHKTSAFTQYDPEHAEDREGYWIRGQSFDITPVVVALSKSPNDLEYKEAAKRLDLSRAVPELGAKAAAILAGSIRRQPKLAAAISRYYDGKELMPAAAKPADTAITRPTDYELQKVAMDRSLFNYYVERILRDGIKQASATDRCVITMLEGHGIHSLAELKDNAGAILEAPRPVKAAATVVPNAEIITRKDIVNSPPADLTDDEREEAMQEGFIIRDTRGDGDKARVYDINVTDQFSNPDESGIYSVLDKSGDSHEVIIVLNPKTIGSGNARCAVVITPDGKQVSEGERNQIYVRSDVSSGFKPLYAKMIAAEDMKTDKSYIVFSGQGSATLPFTVMSKEDNKLMVSVMRPRGLCATAYPCPYPSARHTEMFERSCSPVVEHDYPTTCVAGEDDANMSGVSAATRLSWKKNSVRPVVLTQREGTLKNVGDTMMLPTGCKAFEIDNFPEGLDFSPAGLTDIELCYIKKGGLNTVRVWSDGLGYQIDANGLSPRMDKIAAVRKLVCDIGTGSAAAKMMLKRADSEGDECFHIKLADATFPGGPLTNTAPDGPNPNQLDNDKYYDPRTKTMTTTPSETFSPVDMPTATQEDYNPYESEPNNPPAYMNQKAIEDAISASKAGQKDVMDVSVLGSLVKAMDVDPMVNKYTADLIKGEDRLGRILLLYYWHNDKFKDRYGDNEMQELESVLKNTFKSMGDLILFLRKRGVQIDVALQGSDVDLRELST